MKIGYSYWGYLGDIKYDVNEKIASTPDGNAFYSWSIIKEFQKQGYEVIQVMPDRDNIGYRKLGAKLFDSWCKQDRLYAYYDMKKMYTHNGQDWHNITMQKLFNVWDSNGLNKCDFILHEWRMEVKGRNDFETKHDKSKEYNPDFFIQQCLFEYCAKNNIVVVIFDLDYKLSKQDIYYLPKHLDKNKSSNASNIRIIELGNKWEKSKNAAHVEIPFDFGNIDYFKLLKSSYCLTNLIYVGNRYERDWCIDKYIPTEIYGVKVFGNWTESGRDSEERWPKINFCNRLQTCGMRYEYSNSLCTILLAKKEYLENEFMTARILESVFYGCVPLFIEEYGEECIEKYAGRFANDLTVSSKADVINMIYWLKYDEGYRTACLRYLRDHLKFMDVKNFVNKIKGVV